MALPDSSKDRGVPQITSSRDQKWKDHCAQRSGELVESDRETQSEQLISEAVTPVLAPSESRTLLSRLRSSLPNLRDLLIGN